MTLTMPASMRKKIERGAKRSRRTLVAQAQHLIELGMQADTAK